MDGDLVFAEDNDGNLLCADSQTGQEIWRKNFPRDFGANRPSWGFSESPLVDGDRLICTPGSDQALLVALDKPYSNESGWGVSFAYTFTDAEENRPGAGANDEHFLLDYANTGEVGWKRSVGIARHRLVATALLDGPWGMTYSAKATLESPSTYDATNCFDAVDFNHCFFDPYTPGGSFGRRQLDVAASKDWALGDRYAMNFRIDVLNLFNTRNWSFYSTWRGTPGVPDPTFGSHTDDVLLPTRTLKATLGFSW